MPGAGVGDGDLDPARRRRAARRRDACRPRRLYLTALRQQIDQHLLEPRAVAQHAARRRRPAATGDARAARPRPATSAPARRRPAARRATGSSCSSHVARFDARQVEHVVDHLQQVPAGLLDLRVHSSWCGASGGSRSSSSSCAKPSIAFSGVRSSWLMRDRNSLLARFAASARFARAFGFLQPQVFGDVLEHAHHAQTRLGSAQRSSPRAGRCTLTLAVGDV